jgi:uncharacterized membrane protein YkoI
VKRKVVIAAAAAAVLIGGGAATALTAAGGSHDNSRDGMTVSHRHDRHADAGDTGAGDTGGGRNRAAAARSARVLVQDALAAALKAVPGTVSSAELDRGRSGPAWEVDVLARNGTEHEVTVDATNAEVLSAVRSDDRDDDADDRAEAAAVTSFRTDARAAAEAALALRPGTVTSVDADDDDDSGGRAGAWEVEIRGHDGTWYKVTVDASTGKAWTGDLDDLDDLDDLYDFDDD